jgi:hypothetical protein
MRQNDFFWGVRAGLIVAAVYSAVALLIYAVRGPTPFEHNGTSLLPVIGVYFIGGISGGAVIGICRDLLRERRTAIPVAIFAAIPAAAGVTVLVSDNLNGWTGKQWFVTIVLALFIGIGGVQIFGSDK